MAYHEEYLVQWTIVNDMNAWDATAMEWVPADTSDHKHTADDILFNDVVPTTTLTGCVPNTKLNGGTAIKVNGIMSYKDGSIEIHFNYSSQLID